MSRKTSLLGVALGFLAGAGMIVFMGKNGKKNRKRVLDAWENNESMTAEKVKILIDELSTAFHDLPEAMNEFMSSPKTKEKIESGKENLKKFEKDAVDTYHKGEEVVKKAVVEGEKVAKKAMKDGEEIFKSALKDTKKKAASALRSVSGMKKKLDS